MKLIMVTFLLWNDKARYFSHFDRHFHRIHINFQLEQLLLETNDQMESEFLFKNKYFSYLNFISKIKSLLEISVPLRLSPMFLFLNQIFLKKLTVNFFQKFSWRLEAYEYMSWKNEFAKTPPYTYRWLSCATMIWPDLLSGGGLVALNIKLDETFDQLNKN